jgi:hypothetical protein
MTTMRFANEAHRGLRPGAKAPAFRRIQFLLAH